MGRLNQLERLRRQYGIAEPQHPQQIGPTVEKHQITRIRRETRRRQLTLANIERLTPNMLRLGFTSSDLQDFDSAAFDDHIKLMFPSLGDDGRPNMRDFTPRRFDVARGTLVIDFALHEAGPATQWASDAKVGDTLEIGGPRGSAVVPDDFDWYLLIGDETALPAIGRRVEELRAGVPVTTVVVQSDREAQAFPTKAAWTARWVARDASSDDAALLRAALADYTLPPGDGFVWIAAEASVAKDLRNFFVEERRHPKEWTKAAGYWKRGQADVHERIGD
jgi:NADPH-dependent ferric siderophore reductase